MKNKNCRFALWECVGDRACPILSHNDAAIKKLIHSWQSLDPATRNAILVLAQDEIDASKAKGNPRISQKGSIFGVVMNRMS